MPLNPLSLDVTYGVAGRAFQATVLGLSSGSTLEVLNDGTPGFSTVNGRVYINRLPGAYPVSTVVLRETKAGETPRESRIDIAVDGIALGAAGLGSALQSSGINSPRNPNQIVVMPQDSRGAQITSSGANATTKRFTAPQIEQKKAQGVLIAGMAQSGQRQDIVYVGGIGGYGAVKGSDGNTASSYLTWGTPDPRFAASMNNVEAALSTNALYAWEGGGVVNDLSQNVTAAQLIAAKRPIYERFRLAGHVLLLQGEIGSTALTNAQVVELFMWNAWLRAYCDQFPGQAYYIDAPSAVWDPTNGGTTALSFIPGMVDGAGGAVGPHFSANGAWAVGALLAVPLSQAPARSYLPQIASEVFANGNLQLDQSPLFVARGAQPADANGITYQSTMPLGCTISRQLNGGTGGAATCTARVLAGARGFNLELACTFTQTGEAIQVNFVTPAGTYSVQQPGSRFRAGGLFSVAAGSVNLGLPERYLRATVDGSNIESFDLRNSDQGTGAGPTTAYSGTHLTGQVAIPDGATAVTNLFHRVTIPAFGAGSGTVTISGGFLRRIVSGA